MLWSLKLSKRFNYTLFFSEEVVESFDLEYFASGLRDDYVDIMIQAGGGGITREQYLLEVEKNPLKWTKVYANYFYLLKKENPMSPARDYFLRADDFANDNSLPYHLVIYQVLCSGVLEQRIISRDAWEDYLYPRDNHVNYLRSYALLLEEVELIRDQLLIPVPLAALEWTKTDGIVPPGPDPIKVIVLNKYLVMFLVLEMKVSPTLINAMMEAGAFEFTRKNKSRIGDGWKILETVLTKIAGNKN